MNKIKNKNIKYGKFDLSHEFKFSCDMGQLIPVNCFDVIPGDIVGGYNVCLTKLLAQIKPVLHNVNLYFRTFFVPNRILWRNWEEWITGGEGNSKGTDPEDLDYVKPYFVLNNVQKGSLFDYLYNCPCGVEADLKVDALPAIAYNCIVNNYFLNHNVQDELTFVPEWSGSIDSSLFNLVNVNWEKDYFTSAFPSPQAGTGVRLPLGTTAPVFGNEYALGFTDGQALDSNKSALQTSDYSDLKPLVSNYFGFGNTKGTTMGGYDSLGIDRLLGVVGKNQLEEEDYKKTGLYTDLSEASSANIETLRNAVVIQHYLEKLMKGGWKYKDWLKSFFGVNSKDSRLDLPEYLGGGKSPIFFSEVLQTSETSETPQGNQSGVSSSFNSSGFWKKRIDEHGWIMTLMYIKPRTQYFQGIDRKFTRETKFDYFLPEFQNLGEQAIKNKELYFSGNEATDEAVFGYTARYQEYKQLENRVAGELRDSMKEWHMAREFADTPVLNEEFISCNPTKRIYATEGESNHVICDCANYVYAVRPIKKYTTPGVML